MKKLVFIGITVALTAFAVYDVFDQLNITEEQGKEYLLSSICSGFPTTGAAKQKAREMSVETQVQVMHQLMQFAKEYTKTDEFKEDYKKWRKEQLHHGEKTKLGLPKFGKILDNKINNTLDKQKNQKDYPEDPTQLVREGLTRFLEISATVDFDAELTDGHRFKKSEYEHKPGDWKCCYRAGREVVAAAREDAQKWLAELK